MKYVGDELELFRDARNWKRYFARHLKPFAHGDVLDVGCGIGTNAEYLIQERVRSWTFLEPDAELLGQVPANVTATLLLDAQRVAGTTMDLKASAYDCILYLDVIEHIADDRGELERACGLLRPGGHLILLAPAFNSLFSEFDRAVGHHRRYTKRGLEEALPANAEIMHAGYLDSVGLLLSMGNRLLLRQRMPSKKQILFWDRFIVPISRVLDPVLSAFIGRSVIVVARKPAH